MKAITTPLNMKEKLKILEWEAEKNSEKIIEIHITQAEYDKLLNDFGPFTKNTKFGGYPIKIID